MKVLESIKTKLKVGDTVMIMTGRDAGSKGTVEAINSQKGRVVVKGANEVKKHLKPRNQQSGGIITVSAPVNISNVMLVCPACNKPTRISFDGVGLAKQRMCKKCGSAIVKSVKKDKK